jgi:hypothetical protein
METQQTKQPERPSTASEAMALFRKGSKVVQTSSGAKWLIKKPVGADLMAAGYFSIPNYLEDPTKATQRIKDALQDRGTRLAVMDALVVACVLEPRVSHAPTADGAAVMLVADIPTADRMELLGELFMLGGFAEGSREFFREGAERDGGDPGRAGEAVQDAPAPAAGPGA